MDIIAVHLPPATPGTKGTARCDTCGGALHGSLVLLEGERVRVLCWRCAYWQGLIPAAYLELARQRDASRP